MLKKVDLRFDRVNHLDDNDLCFYFIDYTDGGYDKSKSNSKVLNFKKDIAYRDNKVVWGFRKREVEDFASKIHNVLKQNSDRDNFVLIPCPTSKPKSHSEFNDRLVCVMKFLKQKNSSYKICDCFDRTEVVKPAHHGGSRCVEEIKKTLFLSPPPHFLSKENSVILIDDVLTTGAHFKACQMMIMSEWEIPQQKIIGLFLAKTKHVIEPISEEEMFFKIQ